MTFSSVYYYRDQVKITTLLTTNVLNDGWDSVIQDEKMCNQHCPVVGLGGCPLARTVDYKKTCNMTHCKSSDSIYTRDYQYMQKHGCPCGGDSHGPACDAPFTCRVRMYQQFYQTCGKFDGRHSCGVKNPDSDIIVGDCITPGHCQKGETWNSKWSSVTSNKKSDDLQPTLSTSKAGWVKCQYSFGVDDIIKLQYYKLASDNQATIGPWLDTIKRGEGQGSFGALPPTFEPWLKNSLIISMICQYWYQGLYEGWTAKDPDQQGPDYWDFISTGKDSEYVSRRDDCLTLIGNQYANHYNLNSVVFPVSLLSCLKEVMIVPIITTSGDDVYITFPLSYKYYEEFENSNDRSGYLENLFSWILDDKHFSYNNQESLPAGFEVPDDIDDYLTINSLTINTTGSNLGVNPVGCSSVTKTKSVGVPYKDFMDEKDTTYKYDFIATYNIKCKITMWTPMLMLFALTRIQDSIRSNIVQKMREDTRMLTVSEFRQVCGTISEDKQTCHDYITKYCKSVVNETIFSPELVGKYLFDGNLGGGGNACNCYNSVLQPSVMTRAGNRTAMCFDSNCNDPELQDLFGLEQDYCGTQCSEMWNWMFNSNPAAGKPIPQFFDSARFSDICGKDYTPLESKINITFIAYLSVTMIVVMVCLYLFLLYFKVTNKKKYTILAVTGAVLLGVCIFLPIDMKGTPNCEGTMFPKKSLCKSSITGIPIPDDFCGFMSACECGVDGDCGNECKCSSQVCIPKSSNEGVTTLTKKPKIKYWQFIFSIILTILVMIIFTILLLYQDIYVATFVLCLGMTVIIFTSIPQLSTYIDAQFSNICTGYSPSEGENLSDLRDASHDSDKNEETRVNKNE